MKLSPEMMIDGYKLGHRKQYPEDTRRVYSNWTPRGSRVDGQEDVVLFGLQYFLQRFMMDELWKNFFDQPKDQILKRYESRVGGYLGPNNVGVDHIAALHDLGYVPLLFSSVPEGTRVPLRAPMFVVENTLDDFFWLTNYYETLLSSSIWQACTSATTAYRFRKLLNRWAETTGGDPDFVQWQGHDFSFRGLPGVEAAAVSGAAHLLSFTGTDTLPALDFIDQYYRIDEPEDYLVGGSVAATEHSVMCAGGEHSEFETINRLLDIHPSGILAVVSDTWDLWRVLTQILPRLKDKIMARDGKYVTRPDSGNPADILCGNPKAEPGSPEHKGVVELLWEVFGGTCNMKGQHTLDSHVGAIYGDAIHYQRADEIMSRLSAKGFASDNVVFGIGSFSYQLVTRDTYGFAMKGTWADIGGVGHDLFKKPVTDSGEKFSAVGRLALTPCFNVLERATEEQEKASLMQPIWRDGRFLSQTSISRIRQTLWDR